MVIANEIMLNANLINALQNGVAVFTFIKRDGTLRKAIGTTNARVIAKISPRTKVDDLVVADATNRYFDLEVGAWRRVSASGANVQFLGVLTDADLDAMQNEIPVVA